MLSFLSKYIVPSFLQRLDRYLLVNHPHLWRTRGHYVAFYSFISMILLFVAGYFYPQTLYQLAVSGRLQEQPIFVSAIGIFLSVGVLFGWWYQIQKFEYKRLNLTHFLSEIAIYAGCLILLWFAVFAFLLGYQYRTAYHLEKNIEPNRKWLNDNHFFKPAYIPHYQEDKLNNLNTYFKNGDSLLDRMQARHAILDLKKDNYLAFDFVECLAPAPYMLLPTSYKTASRYYNDFFNDKIGLDATKKPFFKNSEDESFNTNRTYFAEKISRYFQIPVYQELIDNIDPDFYRYIDATNSHFAHWQTAFEKWVNQKAFLEKLSEAEKRAYLNYLQYLKPQIATINDQQLMPSIERAVFHQLAQRFQKNGEQIGIHSNEYYYYNQYNDDNDNGLVHDPSSHTKINYDSLNIYAIASEQALFFIKSLSYDNKKLYANYLGTTYNAIGKPHNGMELQLCRTKSLEYLRQKYPKASLQDSIVFFDIYFSKTVAELTPIFQEAYFNYFVGKYNANDFSRLDKVLKDNGFPKVPAHLSAHQKHFYLLQQGALIEQGLNKNTLMIRKFKDIQTLLYGLFSISCCILAAIIFYIMTISNGLQFWLGIFIGSLLMIFITLLMSMSRVSEKEIAVMFSVLHLLLFIGLIFGLQYSKYQWQYAKPIANSILFSGVISVLLAGFALCSLWRAEHYDGASTDQMQLFIFTSVIAVAIFIYLIIAYLLKRHLTLPKKY